MRRKRDSSLKFARAAVVLTLGAGMTALAMRYTPPDGWGEVGGGGTSPVVPLEEGHLFPFPEGGGPMVAGEQEYPIRLGTLKPGHTETDFSIGGPFGDVALTRTYAKGSLWERGPFGRGHTRGAWTHSLNSYIVVTEFSKAPVNGDFDEEWVTWDVLDRNGKFHDNVPPCSPPAGGGHCFVGEPHLLDDMGAGGTAADGGRLRWDSEGNQRKTLSFNGAGFVLRTSEEVLTYVLHKEWPIQEDGLRGQGKLFVLDEIRTPARGMQSGQVVAELNYLSTVPGPDIYETSTPCLGVSDSRLFPWLTSARLANGAELVFFYANEATATSPSHGCVLKAVHLRPQIGEPTLVVYGYRDAPDALLGVPELRTAQMRIPAKSDQPFRRSRAPVPGDVDQPERQRRWVELLRRLRLAVKSPVCLPDRLAGELHAVSVVDEPVADRVGHGRVADDAVPVVRARAGWSRRWTRRRSDRRASRAASFRSSAPRRLEAEVVEDEDLRLGEAAQQRGGRCRRHGLGELVEETRRAAVDDRRTRRGRPCGPARTRGSSSRRRSDR